MKEIFRHLRLLTNFLLRNKCFSFFEKVKVMTSIFGGANNRDLTIHNLLMKRVVGSFSNAVFFLINGYKIYFKPNYEIIDKNYFLKGVTQVLRETFIFPEFFSSKVNIKEGDVVLDVGGNIGTTTLLFSKLVGNNGKIFVFEPVTYDVIIKNLEENHIQNAVVIKKGISDKAGKVEIEISDFCLDSSICKREYTKNYYKIKRLIEVATLDTFVEEVGLKRVDFINMDIEGAEELAIRGSERIINKYHPRWSISSYHIDSNNEPQHNKLTRLLRRYGYKVKEEKGYHIYAW